MGRLTAFFVMAAMTIGSVSAQAEVRDISDSLLEWNKERFQLRLRGIGVLPEGGGWTTAGGSPDAQNGYAPELDITYFFTQKIAAELILGTTPHDLYLKTGTGTTYLGDSMVLPPTLTAQYHFSPHKKFSPYVGAGLNYTLPYAEDGAGGSELQAEGSFGTAVQAGFDYWVNDHWGVNLDVKKIWVDVDVSINNGATRGNVELDPWVVGAGVSYRF